MLLFVRRQHYRSRVASLRWYSQCKLMFYLMTVWWGGKGFSFQKTLCVQGEWWVKWETLSTTQKKREQIIMYLLLKDYSLFLGKCLSRTLKSTSFPLLRNCMTSDQVLSCWTYAVSWKVRDCESHICLFAKDSNSITKEERKYRLMRRGEAVGVPPAVVFAPAPCGW